MGNYTICPPSVQRRRLPISNHKAGNASDVAARDAGILLSLYPRHGCSVETVARAISRNTDGSASGVIGAVLDAISDDGDVRC